MKRLIFAFAVLLAVLVARDSEAQGCFGPGCGGGSSSSTLTAGTTATSGCTDGGFLYSLTSLLRCGANAVNDGSVITLGGVAGSGDNVVITNGTSTRSILLLKDNTTTVFTVADGGGVTIASNGGLAITGSSTSFSVGTAWTVANSTQLSGNASTGTAGQLTPFIFATVNVSGAGTNGTGAGYKTNIETSTTNSVEAGVLGHAWTDATHASRTSRAVIQTVNNAGSLADAFSVGGTTVASASNIAVITNATTISGTTGIDSITAKNPGFVVTLIFQNVVLVTDGSNLKLAGDFTSSADDTLTLICDGTNWHEIARSVN